MSVDQVSVVDAIGIDNVSDEVVLTISDHLEWGDNEHLFLLQEKINTYLNFVESEEILTVYEKARGRKVLINIVFKYPPDKNALDFLNKVLKIIGEAGMSLRYKSLD